MYDGQVSLLPTQTNINPGSPAGNIYYDTACSLLVLENSRKKLTVASTYGKPGYSVGDRFTAHHDQAGYPFGTLTVVGIVPCHGDEPTGHVPNRKLSLRVFK